MRSNPFVSSSSPLTRGHLPAVVGLDAYAVPTTEPVPVSRPSRPPHRPGRRTRAPQWLGIELDTLKVLVLSVVLLGVVSGLM